MTCKMTVMPDSTKTKPMSATARRFPEKTPTAPANPPRAREPVSPMNTDALLVLNNKKARSAPTRANPTKASDKYSPCKIMRREKQKK